MQKEKRGCWQWEKNLGHGGFGEVSLWKNTESGKYIALKTLQKQNGDKIMERWQTEVEILLKLDHANVVKGFSVPAELQEADKPSLAMQYCSGGDLRHFITRPENRCGLPESDVRFIAHDVASAIEYLHSMKIIHRDLKPDNVVLQTCEDVDGDCKRTVYKLIDLGYAKDLDQDSIAKSFVGTWYYLAPELLNSDRYTATVDYWSFGIIMFEMITGLRPFLQNVKPLSDTWQGHVKSKRKEVIHIFPDPQAIWQHSDKLPLPNQLCRITRNYFEQWLRLMLDFDPNVRGGALTPQMRPYCFEYLDQLLKIQMIHIFCVSSCKLISYIVQGPSTQMHEIMTLVECETKISITNQDLLQSSGLEVVQNKQAQQYVASDLDDAECSIFLFDKQCFMNEHQDRKQQAPSVWVQRIMREPSLSLKINEQRRAWYEALNYCGQLAKNLKQLQHAQRAALLCLLRKNTNLQKLCKEMLKNTYKFRAMLDFFRKSHELDLRKFEEQTQSGIFSPKMHQLWKQGKTEVDDYNTLEVETQQLEHQCAGVNAMTCELQKNQSEQMNSLDMLVAEVKQFVCQNETAKQPVLHNVIVAHIKKCQKIHSNHCSVLLTYISKMCRCKNQLNSLLGQLDKQLEDIKQATSRVAALQSERQKNIWKLVEVALKAPCPPVSQTQGSNGLPMAQLSLSPVPTHRGTEESMTVINEHRTVKNEFSSLLESLQKPSVSSLDWTFLDNLAQQLTEQGSASNA